MNTKSMEIIKVWRKDDLRLTIYDTGKRGYYGEKSRLAYKFKKAGKLLFEGNDFYPSPLDANDSTNTVYSLLAFLTAQYSDVDDGYFDDYSPEQMAWANSWECEQLQFWLYDREERCNK